VQDNLEIIPLSTWSKITAHPFVISGPCSAEGEEQVFNTVREIVKYADGKVHMIRAGIWKPRTRPNAFEGVGEIGLPWVKAAAREVGLPVMVEVANTEHVEAALKNEIDVLWIGARTTVSPFAVQEIADSLKGVDIPVLVKNPVNPDLQLWIGALERFNQVGIKKLGVIHRGFSSYEKSIYRNPPMWEIPCPRFNLPAGAAGHGYGFRWIDDRKPHQPRKSLERCRATGNA
jgi:chorismate mutase